MHFYFIIFSRINLKSIKIDIKQSKKRNISLILLKFERDVFKYKEMIIIEKKKSWSPFLLILFISYDQTLKI